MFITSTVIWMAILCPIGQVKLFTWIRQFYNGIPLCEKIIKEASENLLSWLVCLLFWPVKSYNEDKPLKLGMSTITNTVLHKWQYSKSRGLWLRVCYYSDIFSVSFKGTTLWKLILPPSSCTVQNFLQFSLSDTDPLWHTSVPSNRPKETNSKMSHFFNQTSKNWKYPIYVSVWCHWR